MSRTLVLAFGRCNPPTIGHAKLWKTLQDKAEEYNGDALLCLSKSHDKDKNPLSFKEKSEIISEYMNELGLNVIVEDENTFDGPAFSIYKILPQIYKENMYDNIVFVCGSDRIKEFQSLITYNGKETKRPADFYKFDSVEIVSAGERDEESDDVVSRASASLVRQLVRENKFDEFLQYTPDAGANIELAKNLYEKVRNGMQDKLQESRYMQFLEARKNVHQTHLEDLVLLGKDGFDELLSKVDDVFSILEGSADKKLNISSKIDGSPALMLFSNIDGISGPGISLKGLITAKNVEAAEKAVIQSEQELLDRYGDRPDMVAKIMPFLKYLLSGELKIKDGHIIQGDLLFSMDSLEEFEEYLTFQPNTIVYAVPKDSETGKAIRQKEAGIAVHTVYSGSIGDFDQSFDIAVTQEIPSKPDSLLIMDCFVPNLSGNLSYTAQETSIMQDMIDELKEAHSVLTTHFSKQYNRLCDNEEFIKMYFQTYQNKVISDRAENYFDEQEFLEELESYCVKRIDNALDKKLSSLKTDKGKESAKLKSDALKDEILEILDSDAEAIQWIVSAINTATEIKLEFLEKLSQADNIFETFYKTSEGIIPGTQEGFAISDTDGNICKIVDRSCFSFHNRSADTIKGWQHPEDKLKESVRLKEAGVGIIGIDNLNYGNGEYIKGFKDFISNGKPLYWSKTGTGERKELFLDYDPEIFEGDTDEIVDKLKDAILKKEPEAKWIQKPRDPNESKGKDIVLNTDFQEAIQGYLFEKYWENPYERDKDYVETLFSDDFKSRIDWDVCSADFEKFKEGITSTLTKNGYASRGSWLSYFIAIAKDGSKKIQALYNDGHKLKGSPTAYARGLHSNLSSEIDKFFSRNICGKRKDIVNKADILLVFGPNPDKTAKEYIDACLEAAKENEQTGISKYSNICDEALSDGSVLGLSLKKGVDDVHAELLAATTSVNKDVFGENAATAIIYYGEEDPENTFVSFKEVCETPELMQHIEDFTFVPYGGYKGQEGLSSVIMLPVNEEYREDFSKYINIMIRSNNREKCSVVIEANKESGGGQLGKLTTAVKDELDVKPEKVSSIKSKDKYQICVNKINEFLSWFKKIYASDKSDLIISKIISSCGYPIINRESGESKLTTAPIIKIS